VAEGSRLPKCTASSRWARPVLSTKILLPKDPEIDSVKRLLQPKALSTIYLVQSLVLFPPNVHCVRTSRWWSRKNRESTDSRYRVTLHKTGYISEHRLGGEKSELWLGPRSLPQYSSDIRLFALSMVTNLWTVAHCSRNEGLQTTHQETRK